MTHEKIAGWLPGKFTLEISLHDGLWWIKSPEHKDLFVIAAHVDIAAALADVPLSLAILMRLDAGGVHDPHPLRRSSSVCRQERVEFGGMIACLLFLSAATQSICAITSIALALQFQQPEVMDRWAWFLLACVSAMGAGGSCASGIESLFRDRRP